MLFRPPSIDTLRDRCANASQILVSAPFYSEEGLNWLLPKTGCHLEFWSRLNPYDWAANVVDPPALIRFVNALGEDNISLYFHRTLHAKIYQVDNRWTWIGSPNLTRSAFTTNIELVAELIQSEVSELENYIHVMRSNLRKISLSELNNFVEVTQDVIAKRETNPYGDNGDFEAAVELADEILSRSDTKFSGQLPKLNEFVKFVRNQKGEVAAKVIDHYDNLSGQNRQGHVKQSYYALHAFLNTQGKTFVNDLQKLDIDEYPKLPQEFVTEWIKFVDKFATHTDESQGYSFSILRNVLPESLGGYVTNGGGASGTFRRIAPLVARFMDS